MVVRRSRWVRRGESVCMGVCVRFCKRRHWGGGVAGGEGKGKGQASAGGSARDGALCPGEAAVGFDEVAADGEAEAGAGDVAGAGVAASVVALEEVGELVGRDTAALVCDGDGDLVIAQGGGDVDGGA